MFLVGWSLDFHLFFYCWGRPALLDTGTIGNTGIFYRKKTSKMSLLRYERVIKDMFE